MDTATHEGAEQGQAEQESAQIRQAEALNTPVQPSAPAPAEQTPVVPPVAELPAPELSVSDQRREALNARSRRSRAENGQFAPEKRTAPEQVAPEPVAPAPEALPDYVRRREDGSLYVVQKVDGTEQEESLADLIANAQKYKTGSKRLEEAAAARRQLTESGVTRVQPSQDAAQHGPSPTDGRQGITEEMINSMIFDGDEKGTEARRAIAERLSRESPSVNPDEIASRTTEQVLQQLEVRQAQARVSEDPASKAILDDPFTRQMANDYSAQLAESGMTNPSENISEAVRLTREHLARFAPAPVAPPPLSQRAPGKQAHAASAAVAPSARAPLTAPPQQRDTQSTLNRMRASRGSG